MIFYRWVPKESMFASAEGELKVKLGMLTVWLGASVGLVILSLVAYKSGWTEGAKDILKISASVVGSGGR